MIRVEGLDITLGEFTLRDVNLDVRRAEYVVIMGPTGSGKTALLECLAGLYRPQCGQIWIADRQVNQDPPEHRGVAYVPQDYCLFPHMTVRQNIRYGMRIRKFPMHVQNETVHRLAAQMNITRILDREPRHLSGGERQRTALARALAVDPNVLLLDEPLSAVDESTRDSLSDLLKGLQRDFRVTVVHVTHSLDEALSVGDRIAVFGRGTILQQASCDEVLTRPANSFVARCVGASNILEGQVRADGQTVLFECGDLRIPCNGVPKDARVLIIRPENVRLVPPTAASSQADAIPAVVARRRDRHAIVSVEVVAQGVRLRSSIAATDPAANLQEGDPVAVLIKPEHTHAVYE